MRRAALTALALLSPRAPLSLVTLRRAATVVAMLLLAGPLRAQTAPGRLEGTVTDSVHARGLQGANVLAIRVDPAPGHSAGATTDARGRYRIDSLPAGRYMVEITSAILDSLEIILPPREVTIAPGRATRADFGLPSGRTLRAAACPGVSLARGRGAVVGRVLDADTDAPLAAARVVVAWREVAVDRSTLQVTAADRTGDVDTDSLGRYRLCGVPTDEWIHLQVQQRGRAGSEIRLLVPDSAGVVVRHLSLSATSSRPVADSAVAADSAPTPLTGTAAVSGVIRGVGGLPLGDAQVRVVGARGVVVSDARGRSALGDLPSGTQVLEVRRIGYLLAQQPVELRGGRSVSQDVRLQRIVTLDSIRVLARRSRYREFEEHRKRSGFGTFLTEEDIERRRPFESSDLFHVMPGFRVSGYGLDATVTSSRGVTSLSGPCAVNIVIDGMQRQDINLIHPSSIGAMEVYRPGGPAPVQYDSRCGLIVIWTKRG
ncbi:MAG TPA: TonB-dependent receptor [Gemmatimonadaceae bacterium]|nr:TonB-dependent receptor [Gemmatimonadaceae bacterium]